MELINNMCDCYIGRLCGEDIHKSTIKEMVDDIARIQPQLKEIGMLKGESLSIKQIVDNRRGYLHRFSYCPYCGQKIEWKKIIEQF